MLQFPKVGLPSAVRLAAVCVALIPLLAGCILSENPLSTDKYQDDTLVGHWRSEENPKNIMDLDISRGEGGNYRLVETESNEGKPKVTTYTAFLTKGTRVNYINLLMPRPKKSDAYMIFEYGIKDHKLTVRSGNFEKLKAEIKAGRLTGSFNESTWGNSMELQSPGSALLKLFDSDDGGQFFGEELVFSHIADTTTADVAALLKAQADAWNAGDLDKFMAAYEQSEKITFVSSDVEVHGYKDLEQRYRNKYGASRDTMGTLAFSDLEVTPLGPDHAFCIGHWHVARTGQPELNGIFSLVLTKTDAGWKIIHDHTSVVSVSAKK